MGKAETDPVVRKADRNPVVRKADRDPVVQRALGLLGLVLGPVRARAMFGGYGLYLDDAMFALIARGQVYYRVDEQTRELWAEEGGEPFVYTGKGRPVEMPYWTAPPHAEEAPDTLAPWAERAVAAARRAKAAKRAGRTRR
jgi:DNA transformation protein